MPDRWLPRRRVPRDEVACDVNFSAALDRMRLIDRPGIFLGMGFNPYVSNIRILRECIIYTA